MKPTHEGQLILQTQPGPRKRPVNGGAEAITRGTIPVRRDAGVSTRATPPTRDAGTVLPPRSRP